MFKEKILSITEESGLSNVRIFGSTAREKTALIVTLTYLFKFEDGRTLFDVIRFKQSVEELVGRKVDVVSDQAINEMLQENIMNEVKHL